MVTAGSVTVGLGCMPFQVSQYGHFLLLVLTVGLF